MKDTEIVIAGGITVDHKTYPVTFDPEDGRFTALVGSGAIFADSWKELRTRIIGETRHKTQARRDTIRAVYRRGVAVHELAALTGLPRETIRRIVSDDDADRST